MNDFEIENTVKNQLSIYFMCLCMAYYMCVIASIVVFQEIISIRVLGFQWNIAGALIPYVFLYPIAYVVLKIYGYPVISKMIVSMIIMSLIFVILCTIIINLPASTNTVIIENHLKAILDQSLRLYLAGLIAMPAGAYTSLYMVRILRQKLKSDYSLYIVSTLIGELVNTLLVFLIGFWSIYSIDYIFSNFIISAYLFKSFAAIVTTPMAVCGVVYLKQKAKEGVI